MKLLLAIKSCAQDVAIGANQAIRETCGKDIPGVEGFCLQPNLYFFIGKVARFGQITPQHDEVELPCCDGYFSLPEKTRAILKWSLEHGYDFTFLADTDTWVNPQKLLECGFEKYDLTGLISGEIGKPRAHQGYWAWPSGGAGYFLSARAAKIIADSVVTGEWAEDRQVGQILGPHFRSGDLTAYNCPGFHVEDGITLHYCARGLQRDYDPKWMYECHAKWGKR